MLALARSAGRAPPVIGFLMLSLVAHLAVLRGASLPGWFVPRSGSPPPMEVSLIAVPQPAAPAPAAAPSPRPAASPPRRAARRPGTPARGVSKPSRPAAKPAEPVAAAPTGPAAIFDAFGARIDTAEADAAAAAAGDTAASDERAGGAPGADTEAQAEVAAEAPAGAAADAPGTPTDRTETVVAAPAKAPDPPIVVAPQAGTARYRVHYGDPAEGYVVAMLEQSFEIGPERYRLHSEGRAHGLTSWFYRGTLVQDSAGTVSAAGLAPSSYREQRGNRAARSASIDVDRREVVFGSGARREAPPGTQDRLSVLVQLALLRQSRPGLFEPGSTVELPVLASSRVETAAWKVLGEEQVATDAGTIAALRLSRSPVAGDDEPTIDVWLSLDSRIVPVRIRITEVSGRALDQVIVAH